MLSIFRVDECKLAITTRPHVRPVYENCLLCARSYLYVQGKHVWRRWRRRYLCLVQVSQYAFALCEYRERRGEPLELQQMDGFTVDYCETRAELAAAGGRCFFNLVKEGDMLFFASDDENERAVWIQVWTRTWTPECSCLMY